MRLKPVEGRDNIWELFDRMCSALRSDEYEEQFVGTPAGGGTLTIYWHNYVALRVWCGFRDPDAVVPRRYWNCFGIEFERGEDPNLSPDLEINPPAIGGLNLNNGGVFLADVDSAHIYLGHTGTITINNADGGLNRQDFLDEYHLLNRLPIVSVYRERQQDEVDVILIGRSYEVDFKDNIFGFVKDVRAIKDHYRRQNTQEP